MPYFPSSSSSTCLNPVHSPLSISCDKVVKPVAPRTDEDGWEACSSLYMRSLYSPSTSRSVAKFDEHEEPTSLRSKITKWREGISLGYPDNETLEYWELIGPLTSSPLFMTTSPTCTSFLTTPPSSPRHPSAVSFQCPAHISHSAVGSLYNVKDQSQEDLEIRRTLIGSRCSMMNARVLIVTQDCTVIDNSRKWVVLRKGLHVVPFVAAMCDLPAKFKLSLCMNE
ncbi:hypothetical protein IW261DRAFT_1413902 [Armillaria novae-zelandiae]|uniref:Uncharacterized protein n=1 Tax=Armillaria novae-zelandiae TaxID=153914 RepID=A0AA39UPD8_9AGAR|nr:hypothetical protein IW261DRAFT_1413902 [Armillaria novae-zelandiae]